MKINNYPNLVTFIFLCFISMGSLNARQLYPENSPYREEYLSVSSKYPHQIYFAEYGNPQGLPVLVVHGGPGAGTAPNSARIFDPEFYRIIIFDQRGCGKSKPLGAIEENNTQELIADMEKLRHYLGIDKWMLFGGSWGTALSLLYAESHPESVRALFLRGVTLEEPGSLQYKFYEMKRYFPDKFKRFSEYIPVNERNNLIEAYKKRVFSEDFNQRRKAALEFYLYNRFASNLDVTHQNLEKDFDENVEAEIVLLQFYLHYATNNYFLNEETQILNPKQIDRIKHLPLVIVHGRYDMNCPLERAYKLYKTWDKGKVELVIVQNGGHSQSDLILELVNQAENFKKKKL